MQIDNQAINWWIGYCPKLDTHEWQQWERPSILTGSCMFRRFFSIYFCSHTKFVNLQSGNGRTFSSYFRSIREIPSLNSQLIEHHGLSLFASQGAEAFTCFSTRTVPNLRLCKIREKTRTIPRHEMDYPGHGQRVDFRTKKLEKKGNYHGLYGTWSVPHHTHTYRVLPSLSPENVVRSWEIEFLPAQFRWLPPPPLTSINEENSISNSCFSRKAWLPAIANGVRRLFPITCRTECDVMWCDVMWYDVSTFIWRYIFCIWYYSCVHVGTEIILFLK